MSRPASRPARDQEGAAERRQDHAVRRHDGRATTPASASRASRSRIAGTKVEIIDVRTDEVDRAKAKAQRRGHADQVPDIEVLVGLWTYNTPQIYEAVKDGRQGGQVKVVGFDEDR